MPYLVLVRVSILVLLALTLPSLGTSNQQTFCQLWAMVPELANLLRASVQIFSPAVPSSESSCHACDCPIGTARVGLQRLGLLPISAIELTNSDNCHCRGSLLLGAEGRQIITSVVLRVDEPASLQSFSPGWLGTSCWPVGR